MVLQVRQGSMHMDGVAYVRPSKAHRFDLCNALAGMAKRLCTSAVDPDGVSAYVACRLIPLNQNPGVRPIGIGEVPRRIHSIKQYSRLSVKMSS